MSAFLETAVCAAKESGNYLKQRFGQKLQIEKKGDINLVTDVDRKSEEIIRGIIAERYPDHGFRAEEGTEHSSKSPYLWLVDPLDGTTNYAHGFPFYCVSISLVRNNEIIAGCIYNPVLDECFTAEHGAGAFLGGARIRPSETDNLGDAFLATGFPYDIRTSSQTNLKEFSKFAVSARAIRRAGSAALDLAYVACGRFDGYWEMKLNPWDIAAGILLVEESGGMVTDWQGGKFDIFKGILLASNGRIHRQMVDVLRVVGNAGYPGTKTKWESPE
jgi:myo-inositol-1(or 4)-monophosphatase